MTDENTTQIEAADDADIDPFNCIAPTRGNFASIADALTYYEARMHKARKANRLLLQAATLSGATIEHAQSAAAQVRAVSRAELLKLGMAPTAIDELEKLKDAPEKLEAALTSMAHTFTYAAKLYGERAQILETTCAALLAQATKESAS